MSLQLNAVLWKNAATKNKKRNERYFSTVCGPRQPAERLGSSCSYAKLNKLKNKTKNLKTKVDLNWHVDYIGRVDNIRSTKQNERKIFEIRRKTVFFQASQLKFLCRFHNQGCWKSAVGPNYFEMRSTLELSVKKSGWQRYTSSSITALFRAHASVSAYFLTCSHLTGHYPHQKWG